MDYILILVISLVITSLQVLSDSSQLIAQPLTDIDTTNNTQADGPLKNRSQIVAVNITAFINQTSNELIGLRPIDPSFCNTHPDSPICKPKIEPPIDNQCFRRPNLCDPCMDPNAICPPPKLKD